MFYYKTEAYLLSNRY